MKIIKDNFKKFQNYLQITPATGALLAFLPGLLTAFLLEDKIPLTSPFAPLLRRNLYFYPLLSILLLALWLILGKFHLLRLLGKTLLWFLWGLLLGLHECQAPNNPYLQYLPFPECHARLLLSLEEPLSASTTQVKCRIRKISLTDNGRWFNSQGRVLLRLGKNASLPPQLQPPLSIGHLISCNGLLLLPEADSSYRLYLRTQQIVHTFEASSLHPLPSPPAPFLERLRILCAPYLTEGIRDPLAAGMYQAMVLGCKEGFSAQAKELFLRSSSIHIFSISGLHVAMMAGIFLFITQFIGIPIRLRPLVILPLIGLYALMTGGAPSALRAWIMTGTALVALMRLRVNAPENSLSLAALLLLSGNPLLLFHTGFLFSFTLVYFLLRSRDFSNGASRLVMNQSPTVQKITAILAIGVVTWLAGTGLTLNLNSMLSWGSLLTNLIVPSIASLLITLAIPKLLLAWLFPPLSPLLGKLLQPFLQLMLILAAGGAEDSTHLIRQPAALSLVLLYYALMIILFSGIKPRMIRDFALGGIMLLLLTWGARPLPRIETKVHPFGQEEAQHLLRDLRSKSQKETPLTVLIPKGASPSAARLLLKECRVIELIWESPPRSKSAKLLRDTAKTMGVHVVTP